MHFSTWGLRARLMAMVALSVIPPLALILVSAFQQFQSAHDQAEATALTMARLAASDHQRYLDSSHQLLMALSALDDVIDGNAVGCNSLLAQLHREYPLYTNLFAAKRDGTIFCSAMPATQPTNVSGMDWFRQALANRVFRISRDNTVVRTNQNPAVVLAHPILDPSGVTRGVIGAALDPAWLEQFATEPLPPGWTEIVLDSRGEPLVSLPPNDPGTVLPALGSSGFNTLLLGPAEGVFDAGTRAGELRLFGFARAFSPMESEELTVVVSAPHELAFDGVMPSFLRNLGWLALATVLALTSAWIASELFVLRQGRSLVAATHQLAGGDLSVRADLPNAAPELREVGDAFNRMAATIQARDRELHQAQEELEQRVAERTASLDQANSALLAEIEERNRKEEVLQRAQAQLIQAEKMSALGRLAAALAHEINNPLQAIRTHLELLTMGVPLSDETRQRYASIAQSEVERLGKLVERTLNFAHPTQAPRSPTEIVPLVEQALALTDKRRQQAGVDLYADLQPTPQVLAAPDQLIQVLINLLVNAIESTADGGGVWVSTGVEADQVVIRVADNGTPIPPEHLPHIFEPFFTTKASGTGLGLSISHSLVQEHGGVLSIATNIGDCTVVFTVALPIYEPPATATDYLSHEWVHSP